MRHREWTLVAAAAAALLTSRPAGAEPPEVLRLEYRCADEWRTMQIGALDCTGVYPILPPPACSPCEYPENVLVLDGYPWRDAQRNVPWAVVVRDPSGDHRIVQDAEGCWEMVQHTTAGYDRYFTREQEEAIHRRCVAGSFAWRYYYSSVLGAPVASRLGFGPGSGFAATILHLSLAPAVGLPRAP